MATYTSTTSGDWTNQYTWSPNGVPSVGDTVTIANGHTVTVSSDVTVGTDSGNAITINSGGTLRVTSSGSLFSRGNIVVLGSSTTQGHLFVDGGSLDILEGFGIDTTVNYPKKVTFNNAVIRAVDANRVLKTSANNTYIGVAYNDWWFDIQGTKILGFGNGSTKYSIRSGTISNINGYTIVRNSLFVIYGRAEFKLANTTDISNCDFRGSSFDYVFFPATTISGCTFYNCSAYTAGGSMYRCVFVDGAVYHSSSSNTLEVVECAFFGWSSTTTSITGGLKNVRRCLLWKHTANPHFIGSGVAGNASIVENCVFDGDGYYSLDAGDCVLVGGGASGNRAIVEVVGCIAINCAGTLVTMLNNYSECYIRHCTGYGKDFNGINRYVGASIGETRGTDQHFSMKDSIFVETDAGAKLLSAYVSDSIEYCDYIAHYNLTGSRVPNGTGNSPLLYNASKAWRVTSPVDANYGTVSGWGLHDLPDTNPQFKDPTRRVASYKGVNQESGMVEGSNDMSVNPAYIVGLRCLYRNGYDENGNLATWDLDYSPEKILDWIRDGFRPRNLALKGVASDSGDIGAMPVEVTVYTTGRMPKVMVIS